MTLNATTSAAPNNPLTNAAQTMSAVTSDASYVFQLFNPVTKALFGKVEYRSKGTTKTVGGILACDTYANLQIAAASAGLVGTLSADPTPANNQPANL